jgi:hypothetical protein
LDLALQDVEHLLEVVPVGRQTATRRHKHVDQRVPPGRLCAGNEDRVDDAHHDDVRQR